MLVEVAVLTPAGPQHLNLMQRRGLLNREGRPGKFGEGIGKQGILLN